MKKILASVLLIAITTISCKTSEKEIEPLQIAEQYYSVLNNAEITEMNNLLADRLLTKEGVYQQVYSPEEYSEFLKWDAVFEPSYEILEMEYRDGVVHAKISKSDKRILFLHESPFIINQTIKFYKDRITSVETEYENFDQATWGKNKNDLLTWMNRNHPEFNEVIYDQTESSARQFLKVIEMYKNKS